MMNSDYEWFTAGPDEGFDNCLMCQWELEQIGPVHGPGEV